MREPLPAATTDALERALRAGCRRGLRVEGFEDGGVTLRLPFNADLCRFGGIVCGPALMAAADTAMVRPS